VPSYASLRHTPDGASACAADTRVDLNCFFGDSKPTAWRAIREAASALSACNDSIRRHIVGCLWPMLHGTDGCSNLWSGCLSWSHFAAWRHGRSTY